MSCPCAKCKKIFDTEGLLRRHLARSIPCDFKCTESQGFMGNSKSGLNELEKGNATNAADHIETASLTSLVPRLDQVTLESWKKAGVKVEEQGPIWHKVSPTKCKQCDQITVYESFIRALCEEHAKSYINGEE